MINIAGQKVKGQGHTRLKVDPEAWWKHHSRPLAE